MLRRTLIFVIPVNELLPKGEVYLIMLIHYQRKDNSYCSIFFVSRDTQIFVIQRLHVVASHDGWTLLVLFYVKMNETHCTFQVCQRLEMKDKLMFEKCHDLF